LAQAGQRGQGVGQRAHVRIPYLLLAVEHPIQHRARRVHAGPAPGPLIDLQVVHLVLAQGFQFALQRQQHLADSGLGVGRARAEQRHRVAHRYQQLRLRVVELDEGLAVVEKDGPQHPHILSGMAARRQTLTHLDDAGAARMVDVGGKAVTRREARAECRVVMSEATLRAVRDAQLAKGAALAVPGVGPAAQQERRQERHLDAVKAVVITVSDSRHAGQNPDQSGPAVASLLRKAGYELAPVTIVPDERDQIGAAIKDAVVAGYALIVTTGGTGLGPRDVTPEATAAVLDFEVPGLAEAMRAAGLQKT